MKLYNSLHRELEDFSPLNPPHVGLYTCGMTVYDFAHIGHGRKYTMDDLLRRTLAFNGFDVQHVQNVTDVGHLVSDADEGEDKLEKGAKKTGKTVWEVAEEFTKHFYASMDKLNIWRPNIICKATDHIPEQIAMIEKLIAKGHAYETPEAVYFDVASFPDYGQIFGQNLEDKQVAVRDDVETGQHKKNAYDFVLWFKRVGRFADHAMHWDSPWGDGFPGWHIECSAMSVKYLGEQFDIHTGGIEHMAIHHPNEIAQSEAASGKKPFVKYWLHYGHLMIDGTKMSKSLGNYYTVDDIFAKGYDPLALRYLYLTGHYRVPLNFTWEALDAANNALTNLREQVVTLRKQEQLRSVLSSEKAHQADEFRDQFLAAINNDLNSPQALAVVWSMLKSNIPSEDKYDLLVSFDEVLGLNLAQFEKQEVVIPDDVKVLVAKRQELKAGGDYAQADQVRQQILDLGYTIKDTPNGVEILPHAKKTTS